MEIALIVGQILLKYGPAAAEAWQKIFANPNPTQADWSALWSVTHKSYDDYIRGPQNPAA